MTKFRKLAELSYQQKYMRSARGQKRKPPQTLRREKSGREMWRGTMPQAQRRFYRTLKLKLIEKDRS